MLSVANQVIKDEGFRSQLSRAKTVTIQDPTGTYASSRPPGRDGGYDGKGTRFAWLHIQQTCTSVMISTLLMSCGSPPQSLRVSARFDCIRLHECVRGRRGEKRREDEKAPPALSNCSYHCPPARSRPPCCCISPVRREPGQRGRRLGPCHSSAKAVANVCVNQVHRLAITAFSLSISLRHVSPMPGHTCPLPPTAGHWR